MLWGATRHVMDTRDAYCYWRPTAAIAADIVQHELRAKMMRLNPDLAKL